MASVNEPKSQPAPIRRLCHCPTAARDALNVELFRCGFGPNNMAQPAIPLSGPDTAAVSAYYCHVALSQVEDAAFTKCVTDAGGVVKDATSSPVTRGLVVDLLAEDDLRPQPEDQVEQPPRPPAVAEQKERAAKMTRRPKPARRR